MLDLEQPFSSFRLVDIYKQASPEGKLLIFDVDLTLRDTMCTDTPLEQRALMTELYTRTDGGVALMSGRSSPALDATFDGELPLSAEHHSCMRIEQNGAVISLAPEIDTQALADNAVAKMQELITEEFGIVTTPQAIRGNNTSNFVVYPEVKQYAVALVHSLNHDHDDIASFQGKLALVGNQVLKEMGLSETHEVRAGSDAVELVAKGLTPIDRNRLILSAVIPEEEIIRMEEEGLHKGTAVHNFMSLSRNSGRTPYVVGDSGTDGVAMVECQKYGGGGMWVLNDNPISSIKKPYLDAVSGRLIENYNATWDHIDETVDYLKQTQKVYASTPIGQQPMPKQ